MQKPTEFELAICKAIINVVPAKEEYNYYGDNFYIVARNQTKFFENVLKYTKPTMTKSKELIIFSNTIRLIEETLNPKKNIFNMKIFTIPTIISSKTLELRGLCFIYFSKFLLDNEVRDTSFVYSIIVSLQRFINIIEEEYFLFSRIALEDLKIMCKKIEI